MALGVESLQKTFYLEATRKGTLSVKFVAKGGLIDGKMLGGLRQSSILQINLFLLLFQNGKHPLSIY